MYVNTLLPRVLDEQQRKAIEYFYSPSPVGLFLAVFLPFTIGSGGVGAFAGFWTGLIAGAGGAALCLLLRAWLVRRRIARAIYAYEQGGEQVLLFNGIHSNYVMKVNGAPQQVISVSHNNTALTIKTFNPKVVQVYTYPRQKAYVHPRYDDIIVPSGIFLLEVPSKRSLRRRLGMGLLLLIPLGFVFGLAYVLHAVMDSNSYTNSQPDALVYRQGSKPVLAAVLTHFEANEVSDKGVFGSTSRYAAGFDLETGKRLWKVAFHARDVQGNDAGGAQLLGQSGKYLFFLRNELYVVDKSNGKVVARNDDFPALKDKLIRSISMSFTDNTAYHYSDSLQALVVKGADGLFYTINGNTLQTGTTDISDPDNYFDNKFNYGNNYRDWIASLNDDGQQCITLLDTQDTVLLAGNPDGFAARDAEQSVRRRLYSCAADDIQSGWTLLNDGVFLFGGLLVEQGKNRVQPADTLASLRAFDALLQRYNAMNPPMRSAAGGFIVLHRKTIDPNTSLLLTGLSPAGKTIWQVDTGYTGLPWIYHDTQQDVLYLAGNARQSGSDDLDQVLRIDLKTGKSSTYPLR